MDGQSYMSEKLTSGTSGTKEKHGFLFLNIIEVGVGHGRQVQVVAVVEVAHEVQEPRWRSVST